MRFFEFASDEQENNQISCRYHANLRHQLKKVVASAKSWTKRVRGKLDRDRWVDLHLLHRKFDYVRSASK